jgi:hypothetical protein
LVVLSVKSLVWFALLLQLCSVVVILSSNVKGAVNGPALVKIFDADDGMSRAEPIFVVNVFEKYLMKLALRYCLKALISSLQVVRRSYSGHS